MKDVAPLAISLRQQGLESCGYHGEKMSTHDKQATLENWQKGQKETAGKSARFSKLLEVST